VVVIVVVVVDAVAIVVADVVAVANVVVDVVAAANVVADVVVAVNVVADAVEAANVVADAVALIAAAGVVASTAEVGEVVVIVAVDAVDAGALPLVVVLPSVAEVRLLSLAPSHLLRTLEPLASNVQDMALPAGWSRYTPTTSRPSSTRTQYSTMTVCASLSTPENALNRSPARSAICSG
jgi:hypothetical protein